MKATFCFMILLLTYGCGTSVPKHSPVLNDRISIAILRLKQQHIMLLEHIYDLSVQKVNNDYDEIFSKAINTFEKNTNRKPSTKEDYLKVSIITAASRDRILDKVRNELSKTRRKIGENYDLVIHLNKEVSSYLRSALELQESMEGVMQFIQEEIGINLDIDKEMQELGNSIDSLIEGEKE